jgi:hypothetical protein
MTTHFHPVPRSRMRGAITPLSQYVFMAWCLVKAQEQIYLYLFHYGKIVSENVISLFFNALARELILVFNV